MHDMYSSVALVEQNSCGVTVGIGVLDRSLSISSCEAEQAIKLRVAIVNETDIRINATDTYRIKFNPSKCKLRFEHLHPTFVDLGCVLLTLSSKDQIRLSCVHSVVAIRTATKSTPINRKSITKFICYTSLLSRHRRSISDPSQG